MRDHGSDRLDSWKQIAAYLGRSVRTVERWEREEGLPVHRLQHEKRGTVFAVKTELDAWRRDRQLTPVTTVEPSRPGPWFRPAALGAVVVLLGAAGWQFRRVPAAIPRLSALTAVPGEERMPSFSPDGRQIAYISSAEGSLEYSLDLRLIGAGAPVRLLSASYLSDVAWSPDGRSIAYLGPDRAFHVIPATGGPDRSIYGLKPPPFSLRLSSAAEAPQWEHARSLDWFPDSKRLAIAEMINVPDTHGGRMAIFEVTIESGARSKIVDGYCPRVSPDGKTVGFLKMHNGPTVNVVSVEGGEPRPITRPEDRARDFAWSPDGREIIYAAPRDGFFRLWRVPVAGGEPRLIEPAGYDTGQPAVAAAGNRLAFTQWSRTLNLRRMDLDPGARPQKIAPTTRRQLRPSLSPDGRRLAFISDRAGWPEVWTSDPDGGNPVQVTSVGSTLVDPAEPRWSPDSREIAFHAFVRDWVEVFVVPAQGGVSRPLPIGQWSRWAPSYSRDGRFIYFSWERPERREIWKIARSGGDPVQVTHKGGYRSDESPDGRYLFYSNERKPTGLWKLPTAGGPETLILERSIASNLLWWAVTSRGIAFLDTPSVAGDRTKYPVKLLDPETRAIQQLTEIQVPRRTWGGSFTITPDCRTVYYSEWDQIASSIMLLDSFR